MKKTVKKRKVKKKPLFILLIIFLLIFLAVFYVFNFPITNIYISGNTIFDDQEIIDMAKLSDYPRTFNNNEFVIKNRLIKNTYIKNVKVRKKNLFREVYIDIEENRPLFIYNGQMILQGGQEVDIDNKFDIPVLINAIDDSKVYELFLQKLKLIDTPIYERISEIKYQPNDKDLNRFILNMNDGNLVYITLRKITRINNYIDIISAFDGKKGNLYLDSGEYFEVFGG